MPEGAIIAGVLGNPNCSKWGLSMLQLSTAEWTADDSVPILELTIGGLLRETAARAPDAVALVTGMPEAADRRRWTYSELLGESESAARALLGQFAPGDRVAVWANNIPEWIFLELAAGLAGITLVTVNPILRAEELAYVLQQSRSDGIFFVPEFQGLRMAETLDGIESDLPTLREKVSFDDWEAFCANGSPTSRCRKSIRVLPHRSCTPPAPQDDRRGQSFTTVALSTARGYTSIPSGCNPAQFRYVACRCSTSSDAVLPSSGRSPAWAPLY